MSGDIGIGRLIDGHANRDAIHVAVCPVVAKKSLKPGQHAGFIEGSTEAVIDAEPSKCVGIIDPFLTSEVRCGQWCYLFLYPGSITSLRHEWTHPAFAKTEAMMVIEETARECGLTYDRMMDAAEQWATDTSKWGEYTFMGDNESYKSVDDWGAFWAAYEEVTGTKVEDDKKQCFFSCSC